MLINGDKFLTINRLGLVIIGHLDILNTFWSLCWLFTDLSPMIRKKSICDFQDIDIDAIAISNAFAVRGMRKEKSGKRARPKSSRADAKKVSSHSCRDSVSKNLCGVT